MWADARAHSRGSWKKVATRRPVVVSYLYRTSKRSTAFTLIEILLAIALLGILSAAMVSIAPRLTSSKSQTPQEIFWEAARTARRTALKLDIEVQLSFDSKEKAFLVEGGEGVQKFAVPETRDLTIDLLQARSSGGSILIGGQLVDTQTLPAVSFYPDGTCTPFRVQFRTTGPAHIVAIDPWTCAPVLPEAKKP
jgi:prepilin-type N-terminal cleavage/methylation domain-containing protein